MITYFLDLYDQIYLFLNSTNWQAIVLILQISSLLISILLMWLIVVLVKRSDAAWWLRERARASEFAYGGGENERWKKITARLRKGDEADLKLAIIEADNLMDEIFQRMGLPGQTMVERLKQIEAQEISGIDKIRAAHHLRDQIIQQPDIHISQEQAEEAARNIEDTLKELEYLS